MMPISTKELFENLKTPGIWREIYTFLIPGAFFLVAAHFFNYPPVESIILKSNFTSWGNWGLFFFGSYVLGKVVFLLMDVLFSVVFEVCLIRVPGVTILKSIRDLLWPESTMRSFGKEVEYQFHPMEVYEFREDKPLINAISSHCASDYAFSQAMMGISLLATILLSWKFVLLASGFFIVALHALRRLGSYRDGIFHIIKKKSLLHIKYPERKE